MFWLGAAGFAMAFVGGMAVVVLSFVNAESDDALSLLLGGGSERGVAVLAWEAGLLLMGIATLRARALPLPRKALLIDLAAGAGWDRVGAAGLRALIREGRERPATRGCKVGRVA